MAAPPPDAPIAGGATTRGDVGQRDRRGSTSVGERRQQQAEQVEVQVHVLVQGGATGGQPAEHQQPAQDPEAPTPAPRTWCSAAHAASRRPSASSTHSIPCSSAQDSHLRQQVQGMEPGELPYQRRGGLLSREAVPVPCSLPRPGAWPNGCPDHPHDRAAACRHPRLPTAGPGPAGQPAGRRRRRLTASGAAARLSPATVYRRPAGRRVGV